jgi:predicted transcriptional regulator
LVKLNYLDTINAVLENNPIGIKELKDAEVVS